MIAGPRRLDCSIQGQKIGLVRNPAHGPGDICDILRAALKLRNHFDRGFLPLGIALDRTRGGRDLAPGVREKGLHSLGAAARGLRFDAGYTKASRNPLDCRKLCSLRDRTASSAPAAICSMELRNSFAAAEASDKPLASSSVAVATRSATVSRFDPLGDFC